MKHGSLFSGIGGFDLAAEWMGWHNVFHCEWMPFPQKVLKHYWPEAISYHDITTTDFRQHYGQLDILTGGFPCQPYSAAGKRLGKDDERHLWPHMLRAIREISPRWVVGENVRGLTNWNGGVVFDEVQADLESEGYEVLPFLLPAVAVNAPHRRDRVWFVAYSTKKRLQKGCSGFGKEYKIFRKTPNDFSGISSSQWSSKKRSSEKVCGSYGLPTELDGITFQKWRAESIKGYGNAIVPQVALQIFKAIEQYEAVTMPQTSPTSQTHKE